MLRRLVESKSTRPCRSIMSSGCNILRHLNRRTTTPDFPHEYSVGTYEHPQKGVTDPGDLIDRALDELTKLKMSSTKLKQSDNNQKLEERLTEQLVTDHRSMSRQTTRPDLYAEYSPTLMNVPAPRSDRINLRISRKDLEKFPSPSTENIRNISPIEGTLSLRLGRSVGLSILSRGELGGLAEFDSERLGSTYRLIKKSGATKSRASYR